MKKPGFISTIIYPNLTKTIKLAKKFSALPFKRPHGLIRLAPTKTYSRNTVLLPALLGKTFNVHNGRIFLRVLVSQNIIGHKLGEFSQSRRRYIYKKRKKGKQKGKK